MDIAKQIASEINKPVKAVENVIALLDEGNTIPFIARYRKEAHGAMDDTSLRTLEERLKYLRNLEARKEEIIKSIDEQGKLTDDLKKAILAANTLSEAEDLYRPYKQKRRTRATICRIKNVRNPKTKQRNTLTPKRAWRPWKMCLQARMTSLRKSFRTMRKSAKTCAHFTKEKAS